MRWTCTCLLLILQWCFLPFFFQTNFLLMVITLFIAMFVVVVVFFYYFLYEQSALVFVIISIIIPADNDYYERKILYYTQFYFCYSSAICIISIAFCTRIFVANVIYCHTVILPAIANLNRHKHRIPKGLKYHIVICIIVH